MRVLTDPAGVSESWTDFVICWWYTYRGVSGWRGSPATAASGSRRDAVMVGSGNRTCHDDPLSVTWNMTWSEPSTAPTDAACSNNSDFVSLRRSSFLKCLTLEDGSDRLSRNVGIVLLLLLLLVLLLPALILPLLLLPPPPPPPPPPPLLLLALQLLLTFRHLTSTIVDVPQR